MRLRNTAVVAAVAATALLAPLATTAHAVTTTSTTVAYIAETNGDDLGELWTRPADGSGTPAKLFVSTNDVQAPALSPDGTKIVYVEDDETNQDYSYALYVRDMTGNAPPTLLSAGDAWAPSWSHDGTQVVFSRYDYDTTGIYTVPAAGGTVTPVPTTVHADLDEPSFSPSGRQVAVDWYAPTGDGGGIDLVTLSAGTRAHVAGTAGGSDPVWSPDGQWLLFAKPFGACGYGIYKVPAGGGTPVAVRTVANKYAVSPEFSRDGTQLFWGEGDLPCAPPSNLTPRSFVWVANADGSGPQQAFTNSTHDEYSPTVAGGTPLALETDVPTAPVVNAVGTVAATSATISWTGTPDSTEFVVRRVAHGDPAPATPADGTLVYQGAAHSATATGLVSGTAYDLYVWAYDASGNQSAAPSAVHAVRPYAPPTITPVGLVSTLTPSTSFPVYWNGTTPTFEVSVGEKTKNSAGYWTTNPTYHVVKTTAGKSMAFPGVQGHTYYLRVRGQDGFGNATGYAATTAIVPLNENAALYTAGWTASTGATRWMNSFRGATVAGRSMSLTTDTSSFRVIGDKCPSCGSFKVYVDGVLKATVSSYATTTKVRQVLWTSTAFTSVKSHRIQVVVSGTAGHPRVDLDGFGITR